MAALLVASCVSDPTTDGSAMSEESAIERKFVNSPECASTTSLLVSVDAETAALWRSSEDATRSGVAVADVAAEELGIAAIEPLVDLTMNAERKREYGLDRWFILHFEEEAGVEHVAQRFATMPIVDHVQFNTLINRPSVMVFPATERVDQTRAEAMPFNDPMLPDQWHYDNRGQLTKDQYRNGCEEGEDINLFAAWQYETGSRDVIVAVLDEGVCYTHPDLAGNMWVNEAEQNGAAGVDDDNNGYVDDIYGINATKKGSGNITWDLPGDAGHGTHVAGTVAAVSNNGIGVSGVAGGSGSGDGVRIMSCQIFDSTSNTSSVVCTVRAATYAADMGASILQNSWGYPVSRQMTDNEYGQMYSSELQALKYFRDASNCPAMDGNVVIFAAGNDIKPYSDYPGAYNEFISVASYSADGAPAYYTNHGPGVNVSAPGGEYDVWTGGDLSCVLSTVPSTIIVDGAPIGTDYAYMQGTSMACPHVSGIAALVLSYALKNGITITNDEMCEILTSSVRSFTTRNFLGSKPAYDSSIQQYIDIILSEYRGTMGTGKIDALYAILNLRGTTCVPIVAGEQAVIDINQYLGDGATSVKVYSDPVISDEVRTRLGITNDQLFGNKIYMECANAGIGTIKVQFIAGGDKAGGGASIGGMLIEKELVLVVRETNDAGGWM